MANDHMEFLVPVSESVQFSELQSLDQHLWVTLPPPTYTPSPLYRPLSFPHSAVLLNIKLTKQRLSFLICSEM